MPLCQTYLAYCHCLADLADDSATQYSVNMKLSGGPDFVPKRTQVPADNSTAMIETFVVQSMPALQRPFLQGAFATLSCQAAQPLILLRMSKLFANQTSAWCNVQVSGLYAISRVWQLYNFQILNPASKVDSQQDNNHPGWVCKSYKCILGCVWVRPVQGRRPDWSGVAFRQRVYGPGIDTEYLACYCAM